MLTHDLGDALILEPNGIHDVERDLRERPADDLLAREALADQVTRCDSFRFWESLQRLAATSRPRFA